MRTLANLGLTIGAAVLFAGCSGWQSPIGAPGAMPQSRRIALTPAIVDQKGTTPSYEVLHSFGNDYDGTNPSANLIDVGGKLYGTAEAGGPYSCKYVHGCGTVFSITPSGTAKVLHSFDGSDGYDPLANLIDVKGTLYGTTAMGGKYNAGTVFSITTDGTEKVLHNFGSGTDGTGPVGGLIDLNGSLYGTTKNGGALSGGTVFSITTTGTEKVLHSFGYGTGGGEPEAGLTNVNGTLYGTTVMGGVHNGGIVFSITPGGAEKVLHDFGKGTDGYGPNARMIAAGMTLYGTTQEGGKYGGGGTVFSITTSGTEKVLHSFGELETDGRVPSARVIDVKGTLYGTTTIGGKYTGGTIFSVTKTGEEKVLHYFGDDTDGADPRSGLIDVGGTLYGTTWSGGLNNDGTVFSLVP
jgi:uncharacterized repeat protein (TIGR03803 family)